MIINYLSCNTSPLSIFVPNASNVWDTEKVRHLHNRLGFGIKPSLLNNVLSQSPAAYIDNLIDSAKNLGPSTVPGWAPLDSRDYDANGYGNVQNFELVNDTKFELYKEFLNNEVRGRLTLFWHNHLVTNAQDYGFAGYAFRYFHILQRNCLGNFKEFVREIGVSGAMLRFLNGYENEAGNPNENYARELYELFTLGEGNGYTEADIQETARALTGYNHNSNGYNSVIIFKQETFDSGEKTIFGQTGNWGYDDVIDILFEQRGDLIAQFICEKMYKKLVSPTVDATVRQNIINPLAVIFKNANFEIAPVVKALFKSEHFFDQDAMSVIIKSPIDLAFQFLHTTDFNFGDFDDIKFTIMYNLRNLAQDILFPPTVAGWDGDKDWINSGVFVLRQTLIGKNLLRKAYNQDDEQLRQFAIAISGNSSDIEVVAKDIFDALMVTVPYTMTDFDNALDVFKSRVPANYFEQDIWNLQFESAPLQVRDLIEFIVALPDYQLK